MFPLVMFANIHKSNINVYAKNFGNPSVRVWNALQSKIDVNVPISKKKYSLKISTR